MLKILVPYDWSPSSQRALKMALKFSKLSKGSKIILLNVLKEWWLPYGFTGEEKKFQSQITKRRVSEKQYIKEISETLKEKARKSLVDIIKKHKTNGNCIIPKISIGRPADKIIEISKKEKIDLIIMGTTSRRGISRITALGSVSREVVEKTDPVMLVH